MQRLMKNRRTGKVAVFDQSCVDGGQWEEVTEQQTAPKSGGGKKTPVLLQNRIRLTGSLNVEPAKALENALTE